MQMLAAFECDVSPHELRLSDGCCYLAPQALGSSAFILRAGLSREKIALQVLIFVLRDGVTCD